MGTSFIIIAVYILALLIWSFLVFLALRMACTAKKLSKKAIPLCILFLTLSAILLILSVFYLVQGLTGTTAPSVTTPTTQY